MIRFMPGMDVAMFQHMYTVGFDENGVPLLPSGPLVYFSPKGENCAEAVAGEMQGLAANKALHCRVIGLISAFNDCAIVHNLFHTSIVGVCRSTHKVAGSMSIKIRGAILYSN